MNRLHLVNKYIFPIYYENYNQHFLKIEHSGKVLRPFTFFYTHLEKLRQSIELLRNGRST